MQLENISRLIFFTLVSAFTIIICVTIFFEINNNFEQILEIGIPITVLYILSVFLIAIPIAIILTATITSKDGKLELNK